MTRVATPYSPIIPFAILGEPFHRQRPESHPLEAVREKGVRNEIERLVRETSSEAAAWTAIGGDLGRRIHRFRRATKRLRALARLLREPLGSAQRRRLNTKIRDLARLASAARDADVLLETWRSIDLPRRGRRVDDFAAQLEERAIHERTILIETKVLPRIGRELRAIGGVWLGLLPKEIGAADLRPGVEAATSRARQQLVLARRVPTRENLHELRKRAKVVLLHAHLLAPAGRASCATSTASERYLGKTTIWRCSSRASNPTNRRGCRSGGRRSRNARLGPAALKLAGRLFAARPRDFARRLVP